MELSFSAMDLMKEMVEKGNPNSVSDAGVGALCLNAAVSGAFLNVRINAAELSDPSIIDGLLAKASDLETMAKERCEQIQKSVLQKINSKF
jgi:glutamate formiminotransferase/formiminotetrahydrofolate cyclodeaminase